MLLRSAPRVAEAEAEAVAAVVAEADDVDGAVRVPEAVTPSVR